jgi:hypothetical protein
LSATQQPAQSILPMTKMRPEMIFQALDKA